jgi:hypothetical protein
VGEEAFQIRAHKRMENGLGRPPGGVCGSERSHAGFRMSRAPCQDRRERSRGLARCIRCPGSTLTCLGHLEIHRGADVARASSARMTEATIGGDRQRSSSE